MRIWLAPSRYVPHLGGIETVVAQLATELATAGDEVLVLTHRHPADLPEEEVLNGIRVRRLRFESPARDLAATRRFISSYRSTRRSLLAEPHPDVIHIHGGSSQLLHLARFTKSHRIPLVVTTHGEISGDVHDVYGRSAYIRSSFRYAARCAGAVTAPSRHTLDEAGRLAPAARSRGQVVPNGIRAEGWSACPPAASTGRVLAWGRLEYQKGFDRLLAAWPAVRRQVPHAELRIAGEGSARAALERMLSPGAHLLGRLDQQGLLRELAHAQFAAVPSRVEAFGMSALEALAAGRAVLHEGLPALTEVVGPHGWRTTHEDPEALGHALAAALAEPPRHIPLDAVAHYTWPFVVQQFRDLYAAAQAPARR